MSLVQSRQYKYAYGQNTYHKVERGEKTFAEQSDANANARKYEAEKARENVGESFADVYDDLYTTDNREYTEHRHFLPKLREADIRRTKGHYKMCQILQTPKSSEAHDILQSQVPNKKCTSSQK